MGVIIEGSELLNQLIVNGALISFKTQGNYINNYLSEKEKNKG